MVFRQSARSSWTWAGGGATLHSATPNDGFSPEGLRLLHRIRLAGNLAPVGPDTCAR